MIDQQVLWKKISFLWMNKIGFLKNISEEHIFPIIVILRNIICQKQNTSVAYLDVEKVFDKKHNIIVVKTSTNIVAI